MTKTLKVLFVSSVLSLTLIASPTLVGDKQSKAPLSEKEVTTTISPMMYPGGNGGSGGGGG